MLLLTAAFILNTALYAQRAVVMGNILNTKVKTAETSYNSSVIAYKEFKQTTAIDKNGNFKLQFNITGTKLVALVINEQQTTFYVEPGDSITLKINYTDFDSSLVFSGRNSEKNNLLKAFDLKFNVGHEQDLFRQNGKRNASSFATYCDSLLKEKMNFISAFAPKPGADLTSYYKSNLIYENAVNKLQYPGIWAYMNRKRDSLPDMLTSYFNFIKNLPVNLESLLNNSAYFNYLNAVFRHHADLIFSTSGSRLTHEENVQLATMIFKNEKIVQALEAHFIYNAFEHSGFQDAEKAYKAFVQKHPGSPYGTELDEQYSATARIAPGQPAPEFTLTDDQGKQRSLSEFKGKVVYLDFWASWCGPCMTELPYAKKLKDEFAKQDVVFLYVSIDDDAKSWKDAIAKHNIAGVHLNAAGWNNSVCKAYNIQGVPAYFLIGKSGSIANNNPARPSSGEVIIKEINALLK